MNLTPKVLQTCCKCDRLPSWSWKLEKKNLGVVEASVSLWVQQIQITLPATKLTNAQPHADQVSIHSSGPYMPGDLPARCCLFLRPDLDVKFKILKLSHQIYVAHAWSIKYRRNNKNELYNLFVNYEINLMSLIWS